MSRSEAHDARNTAFREAFRKPVEFGATCPPTGTLIETEAQKLNLEHHVEDVPVPNGNDAKLHWLGDRSAKKVILYFHGGGFCLPPLPGHMLFVNQIQQHLASKGKKVVFAVLEYGLTLNKSKYPSQILQGTEALRHILNKGYEPSNIVLGGDSAGANLSLAVISVILHSFPGQGVEPLKLNGQLAGLLLISPWVSFGTHGRAWTENPNKDCIPAECQIALSDAYTDASERNNYSEAVRADVDWWKGIPAKSILNVWGGDEVLADSIAELGQKLEKAGNNVENVECPLQVHIDCILDLMSGLDVGLMTTKVLDFLSSVV